MTKDEALLYLPFSAEDDLIDLYDDKLHEFRQFFIGAVPTSRVYGAKIKQLNKVQAAYDVLSGSHKEVGVPKITLSSYDDLSLSDLVLLFQRQSNILKQRVMQSRSVAELCYCANMQLVNMREYSRTWKVELDHVNVDVKVTQPVDEMGLLKELDGLKEEGIQNVEDLLKLGKDKLVVKEAIRLSLWRKIEGNG